MNTSTLITELPPSPASGRHSRVVRYTIATLLRLACIALLFVVPDWWRLIPAASAIVLPYVAVAVAVVIANRVGSVRAVPILRPGAIVRKTASAD